jgi:hypothetical protein
VRAKAEGRHPKAWTSPQPLCSLILKESELGLVAEGVEDQLTQTGPSSCFFSLPGSMWLKVCLQATSGDILQVCRG